MKTYTLHEVSTILKIPKSTLRYWEQEALIRSQRNEQNEYREYTPEELLVIADIAFYRGLRLPIRTLKHLREQSIQDKLMLFDSSCQAIDQQIQELEKTKQKIIEKVETVHIFEALKDEQFHSSVPEFSYICHLHMEDQESVENYLKNPCHLAICLDEQQHRIERYGLTQNYASTGQTILWKKNPNSTYLPCMIPVVDRVVDVSTIQTQLYELHARGQMVGNIIGNYLISDKHIDYFQAWIEVLAIV